MSAARTGMGRPWFRTGARTPASQGTTSPLAYGRPSICAYALHTPGLRNGIRNLGNIVGFWARKPVVSVKASLASDSGRLSHLPLTGIGLRLAINRAARADDVVLLVRLYERMGFRAMDAGKYVEAASYFKEAAKAAVNSVGLLEDEYRATIQIDMLGRQASALEMLKTKEAFFEAATVLTAARRMLPWQKVEDDELAADLEDWVSSEWDDYKKVFGDDPSKIELVRPVMLEIADTYGALALFYLYEGNDRKAAELLGVQGDVYGLSDRSEDAYQSYYEAWVRSGSPDDGMLRLKVAEAKTKIMPQDKGIETSLRMLQMAMKEFKVANFDTAYHVFMDMGEMYERMAKNAAEGELEENYGLAAMAYANAAFAVSKMIVKPMLDKPYFYVRFDNAAIERKREALELRVKALVSAGMAVDPMIIDHLAELQPLFYPDEKKLEAAMKNFGRYSWVDRTYGLVDGDDDFSVISRGENI